MSWKHLLSGALAVLLLSGSGWAQSEQEKKAKKEKPKKEQKAAEKEETKLFQLDEIVIDVIEKRRDVEIPNMTVVKPELFPLSIGTAIDTALERQAGVDVQRIQEVGTAMDDDSIKIRGLSGRRIKVLRDGRLLNTSGAAGGYFIDFTMIPLTDVDRVEVIKGIGDARFGNSLGGIINLVPRRIPSVSPKTEIDLSAASFLTLGNNIYHAYKPGAFEYALTGRLTRSDGYLWNGTMNSGYFNAHLGYDFSFQGRLTVDVSYSRIKKGFIVSNRLSKSPDDPAYAQAKEPGFLPSDGEFMYGGMGGYPEPGSWWTKYKWLFELGFEQSLGRDGVLSLFYWRNYGNREAYNTRAALNRVFHKIFYDDRSQGFSASYRGTWGRHHFSAGLDYDGLSDDGDANKDDDFRAAFRNGNYVSARNLGLYALTDVYLWRDRLFITPGVRYVSYHGLVGPAGEIELIPSIRMSGWAPSIKLTYLTSRDSSLYFSVARALRMPTAPEHYWHYDPDDAGVNTSGLPFQHEDGVMVQAGWRTLLPSNTQLEISPYFYRVGNYIQFDLVNFVSYNIRDARLAGIELEIVQQWGKGWSSFLNYSYQRSRTEGDTFIPLFVDPRDADFDEIPGLPAQRANFGVRYRMRNNASLGFFAQAVSEQKVIYNNNTLYNTKMRVRTQPAYVRFDLELRYPVSSILNFNAFVRNLFAARYQERFGFPVAGRTAGVSLKAGF
ncbi:MAG: TonB-dependent receptor [Candidatus Aminicenantes bacterium]|nr:TonB-dependent receptor [Candidatus Aminicenantes bacterium]